MKNSDYVTLVLAGGEGKRLGVLTENVPKPILPFGGAYRLIDFTLSNCKHSGAGVIGVIAQYYQHKLIEYVGSGKEWLSEGDDAEFHVLTPNYRNGAEDLYFGTADAIWKNTEFISRYNPENIVVLSADHVYKMDYNRVIEAHRQSRATATIVSRVVPWREVSRFGIISATSDNFITTFDEKPLFPKSNLASIGVYVFNWASLRNHLFISSIDPESKMDIGRDIIPQMLKCGEKIAVYKHNNYWKDVGDIHSFWEGHMDLLLPAPSVDLHSENWKIISRDTSALSRYDKNTTADGHIENSLLAERVINRGSIVNSVVFSDVTIGEGAQVIDSVIMPEVRIEKGAVLIKTIIGSSSVIGDNTAVGGIKTHDMDIDYHQGVCVVKGDIFASA